MNDPLADFKKFMERRDQMAAAYVNGDYAPLQENVTHAAPATFFGPGGGYVRGASEVSAAYEQGSHGFDAGGESKLEIIHLEANDDLACWVGIQRATVKLKGQQPQQMDLRITEIFRREREDWRLVHRHADTLVEPQRR